MLYREIIAVCSQIHTKHINTLCGQNVEVFSIKHDGTYNDHWALKFSPIYGYLQELETILNFGINWTLEVRFTLRPLRPHGKSPHYALDKWLGGPQAGLDSVEKGKYAAVGPQPSYYTNWSIPALIMMTSVWIVVGSLGLLSEHL